MKEKEIYEIYKVYMSSDEYFLWEGKPEKGHLFSSEDIFMMPLSFFWCIFAFSATLSILTTAEASVFDIAINLVFFTIGLYIFFGRFVYKAYRRKHTRYIITNKKIFSCYKNTVKILNRFNIAEIHLKTYKDGNGNITFWENYPLTKKNYDKLDLGSERVSLMNIKDVHSVYKILVEKPD